MPAVASWTSPIAPFCAGSLLRVVAALAALLALSTSPAGASTWLPAQDVSLAGNVVGAEVAMNGAGDAAVAWTEFSGGTAIIRAAVRPAGASFRAVSVSAVGGEVSNPRIAVTPRGEVLVVWLRRGGGGRELEMSVGDLGGSFSAPKVLSETGDAAPPRLAVNATGDAVIAWVQALPDGSSVVRTVARQVGGTLADPVDLSDPRYFPSDPEVAINEAGEALVAWTVNAPQPMVETAFRDASGAWRQPSDLLSPGDVNAPRVAIGAGGEAVVAWRYRDATNHFIARAALRSTAGTFADAVDLSPAGRQARAPRVAMDASGHATVVWDRADARFVASASLREPGGGFQGAVDLSALEDDALVRGLAANSAGDTIAVWTNLQGRAQAVTRTAGMPFGAPLDIFDADHLAGISGVAIDLDGDAIAVAVRETNTGSIVQIAGLDAAGPQLRSVDVPSGGRAGEPIAVSARAVDTWSGVASVKWDFGDERSSEGRDATHVYATPGRYLVTLRAVDGLGNATTTTRTVEVSSSSSPAPTTSPPSAGGSAPPPALPPRLSALRLTRRAFFVTSGRRGRDRRRIGTTLVYRDTQPAVTTVVVRRIVAGKSGRTRRVGSFSHKDRAGTNHVKFAGIVNGRRLTPGRYAIILRAVNTAGRPGNTLTARIRIRSDRRQSGNSSR